MDVIAFATSSGKVRGTSLVVSSCPLRDYTVLSVFPYNFMYRSFMISARSVIVVPSSCVSAIICFSPIISRCFIFFTLHLSFIVFVLEQDG
ncbi:hypothetical protein FKM82_007572 [Ascaphus truei]